MNQSDKLAAYLFDRKDDGLNNFKIVKSLKKLGWDGIQMYEQCLSR